MRVELICAGTELLTEKVNTNVVYLGERLASIGLKLSLAITVGDDREEMEKAVKGALERSNVLIITGGLGPTFDDLTREAAAGALGRKLIYNEELYKVISERFAVRGIEMPENNKTQAYLIQGAVPVDNKNGTAPGQILELDSNHETPKILILLPGPPKEVHPMVDSAILPYLKRFEHGMTKSLTLHVFGMAESAVDEKIRPIINAERKLDKGFVDFTILAHQLVIDIKTTVTGPDEMLIDETINNLKTEFYGVLGGSIYGENADTLESVVGKLLAKNKRTLAAAESCTGGLISARVTNVPGSSAYFKEGAITYSNESKIRALGVNENTIEEHGAVSGQAALEMAEGIRKAAGSDYGLSVTGIAGPAGGTKDKPVGLVFIGLSGPLKKESFRYELLGSRTEVRDRAVNLALNILRLSLLEAGGRNKKIAGKR